VLGGRPGSEERGVLAGLFSSSYQDDVVIVAFKK